MEICLLVIVQLTRALRDVEEQSRILPQLVGKAEFLDRVFELADRVMRLPGFDVLFHFRRGIRGEERPRSEQKEQRDSQ
jgi:hypothetical protein